MTITSPPDWDPEYREPEANPNAEDDAYDSFRERNDVITVMSQAEYLAVKDARKAEFHALLARRKDWKGK